MGAGGEVVGSYICRLSNIIIASRPALKKKSSCQVTFSLFFFFLNDRFNFLIDHKKIIRTFVRVYANEFCRSLLLAPIAININNFLCNVIACFQTALSSSNGLINLLVPPFHCRINDIRRRRLFTFLETQILCVLAHG